MSWNVDDDVLDVHTNYTFIDGQYWETFCGHQNSPVFIEHVDIKDIASSQSHSTLLKKACQILDFDVHVHLNVGDNSVHFWPVLLYYHYLCQVGHIIRKNVETCSFCGHSAPVTMFIFFQKLPSRTYAYTLHRNEHMTTYESLHDSKANSTHCYANRCAMHRICIIPAIASQESSSLATMALVSLCCQLVY